MLDKLPVLLPLFSHFDSQKHWQQMWWIRKEHKLSWTANTFLVDWRYTHKHNGQTIANQSERMICTSWSWHCPVWKLWLWADRFIWMILNIYYWTGIWHCFSACLTKTLLFEGQSITCWSGPCVSSAIKVVVYIAYMCLDWYFYKTDEIVQQPLKERDGNNYQNVDNCEHT